MIPYNFMRPNFYVVLTLLCVSLPIVMSAEENEQTFAPGPRVAVNYKDTLPSPGEDYVESDLSYGVFMGTGPRFTPGRLNEFFSWAWDFTIGARVGWRRIGLEGSVAFASPTVKRSSLVVSPSVDTEFRANVKSANYSAVNLNLGYSVLDTDRFAIVPYAGCVWTRYSWISRPLVDSADGSQEMGWPVKQMVLSDFNVSFGVRFHWKFDTFFLGGDSPRSHRQKITSSLELTPYMVRGVYSDARPKFSGWQFGLRIGYSASARPMKKIPDLIP